eukprot:s1561_g2.t2
MRPGRLLPLLALAGPAFMLKPLHSLTTTLNLRPVTWPGLVYGNSTVFHFANRPETQGHVALTIDDGLCRSGAERSLIPEVRRLLQEHGATATFFLCSDYVNGFEEEAQQLLAEHHEFGNHCPCDGVDYYSMPPAEFETQVPACSGTDEVSPTSTDPWTCDKFGEDSEECVKHFQKHETGHFQCVLRDAGVGTFNCLTGHRCVVANLDALGQGHCEEGQIYASAAWELAPSSGGTKGFKTAEYKGWVKDAWAKCLVKNPATKFISVWTDAGYRCYTAASCKPNGIKGITSFTTSVELNSIGKGHCEGGQIYASCVAEVPREGPQHQIHQRLDGRGLPLLHRGQLHAQWLPSHHVLHHSVKVTGSHRLRQRSVLGTKDSRAAQRSTDGRLVRLVSGPQELLKTSKKIQELSGAAPRWFRAPQGKFSGSMHGVVSKYGMQHALGDCYCDDWAIEDSDWVAGTMLQQVRGGSVLILHMPERGFREHILKALELLLIGLKQKGLTAVTLSQLSHLAAPSSTVAASKSSAASNSAGGEGL